MTTTALRDAAVEAWTDWDDRPTNPQVCNRFHSAIADWATAAGLNPHQARISMIRAKRDALRTGTPFDRTLTLQHIETNR